MEEGPTLEVIQTETLGFLAIAGDAKVQLTPPWSAAPAPTASLLSIASRKGLAAAAGPDAVYLSSTESARKAFSADKTGDTEFRAFDPQVKISMPMRISHLAFTPDENCLILSAEQGGGLAVYETQALLQGSSQTAFEISTSGESVRALVPNPMPELAEFCAVVTTNGNLLMANLKDKSLVSGSNGPVIRSQVACCAWSTKGKQLVAGMSDGTVVQMTPDGAEKAQIYKPDAFGDVHVSSVSWLENHLFLVIYTENSGEPPASEFCIVTRRAPSGQPPSFDYRKLADPVLPFGNEKAPHHTVLRLRDYPPNIQDMLIVASTAHDGLGLLTRSKAPLASDVPAEAITGVFTTTEFTDDSKRAEVPSDPIEYTPTYPIGVSLDLSSNESVYRPIPQDEEYEQSPGPLPALWALNHSGVLSAWWVVYNDAIREGKTYPGMAVAESQPSAQTTTSAAVPSAMGSQAVSSPFGGSSAFATTAPALAQPTGASNPFGTAAPTSSTPTFGAPSFGAPSVLGSQPAAAFGQAGGLGAKVSPWAKSSAGGAAPSFGSSVFSSSAAPSAGASSGGKIFGGAASTNSSAGGGFASFASKGGFGSLGGDGGGGSIFSNPSSSSSPFGASTNGQSVFGSGGGAFGSGAGVFGPRETNSTAFPSTSKPKEGSGLGSGPFVLGTTFKADPASANDNEKPVSQGGFGLGGFGSSLDDAASKPADPNNSSKDEDMDAQTTSVKNEKPKQSLLGNVQPDKPQTLFGGQSRESTTPTSTPAPSKLFSTDPPASRPNPFSGKASASSPFGSASTKPSPFGSNKDASKPKQPLQTFAPEPGNKDNPFASISQNKPNQEAETTEDAGDAPLPPESTSKAVYPFGDSSSSSTASAKSAEGHKKADVKAREPVKDLPLPPDSSPGFKDTSEDTDGSSAALSDQETPAVKEPPLPPFPTESKSQAIATLFSSRQTSGAPGGSDRVDSSSQHNGDQSDAEGAAGEDEEGESESEGSGIDVAKDLSPNSTGAGQDQRTTPQSSFGGMGGSAFSVVSRAEAAQQQRSSLGGDISRNAPVFVNPVPISPRSPSPVRGAVPPRMFPADGSRSVSAPGMASHILAGSRSSSSGHSAKTIKTRLRPQEDLNVALQRQAKQKLAEQDVQGLEDDEFEHVQNLLDTEVQPSLDIGEFNAFNSVTADVHASTVAAQVEALYRDINGMLVTLGLNARALKGFIKGHEQRRDNTTKDDLAIPDDWVLCEAEDLGHILDDHMAPELEDGRLQDIDDTWDMCQGLAQEMPKLRAKHQDVKRILGSILDPDQAAAHRSMPLNAEQAGQQTELRQSYARLIRLMTDAEGALTMLKTKLASVGSSSGKPAAVPTVDAVMRTITRMTSAAEKRSGDLDVLESQMRKLRFTNSVGPPSRDGSPFMTPPSNKRQSLLMSSSIQFTPSPRKSLMSSVGSLNGGTRATPAPSPRKKMSGFTDEDKDVIRGKMQKRQTVLDRLRSKLKENGPKMSSYEGEN
ncbi:hypothetical protein DHEL01_v210639 [Diaporthe helianthi]|uniref:Nucleoporin Nup159/Nup146 N-terminal domain-containing protein n=1 Tax=Diaporthe helianthi TaxID=158607 RepID=A0A2P5HL38_DIAHE|nr:hypothetical protein DHEL01_v210639 [Diaporthe helianthi]